MFDMVEPQPGAYVLMVDTTGRRAPVVFHRESSDDVMRWITADGDDADEVITYAWGDVLSEARDLGFHLVRVFPDGEAVVLPAPLDLVGAPVEIGPVTVKVDGDSETPWVDVYGKGAPDQLVTALLTVVATLRGDR